MVKALIIYGPPGSGKGTQAELLARKSNFIHFDTGRYIESLIRNPKLQKNPIISREKKIFNAGLLCTPEWVLKITREAVKKIRKAEYGVVFSGSPRTVFEAFGDKTNEGLLSTLIKLYGRKDIFIIRLDVKGSTTIKRNSARLVCSVCGLPILRNAKIRNCALCNGPMRIRSLDKPSVIKTRLKEYQNRTFPILKKARAIGIIIKEFNGEPSPYKVFRGITKYLKID